MFETSRFDSDLTSSNLSKNVKKVMRLLFNCFVISRRRLKSDIARLIFVTLSVGFLVVIFYKGKGQSSDDNNSQEAGFYAEIENSEYDHLSSLVTLHNSELTPIQNYVLL